MPKVLTNVKDDICRVSRQMLAEEGYEKFSIRTVAGKCGIGMGTIYNYYSSKDEIIKETVMNDWEIMLRRMDHSNRTATKVDEKLASIYACVREFVIGFHGTWIEMALAGPKNVSMEIGREHV